MAEKLTDKTPLSSKVTYGTAGAGVSAGLSFAVSDLAVTLFKSLGWMMTATNEMSIQVIMAALMAYGGSFLAGYMKDSGFTVSEQERELKEAKAKAKKD